MKFNDIKNNFSKGELDPNFIGRPDIDIYNQGCALLENMLTLPQGGATKRPGTFVVSQVTNTTTTTNTTFRDFEMYPVLVDSYSVTGEKTKTSMIICICLDAIGADFAWIKILTASGEDYTSGFIANSDTIRPFKTINTSASVVTNELFTSKGELDFSYAQNGNFVFFAHKSGRLQPFYICFTSYNSGVITNTCFPGPNALTTIAATYPLFVQSQIRFLANFVPYSAVNVSDITFTPSGTTGSITITSSANFFYNTITGGDSWKGTIIAITHTTPTITTGFAYITGRVSNTAATAFVIVNFGASTASTNWRISLWNGYYGFPRSVTIHESRIVYAGSPAFPDRVWVSETNDFLHMRNFKAAQDGTTDTTKLGYFGPIVDTDAFDTDITGNVKNSIKWVYPFRNLMFGTEKGMIALRTGGQPLAYNTVSFTLEDSAGCGFATPIQINSQLFYTDSTNQKVLLTEINENTGAYSTQDVTALNYNIITAFHSDSSINLKTDYKISKIVYLDNYKTLFMRVSNLDFMVAFGYSPSAAISAWSRHKLAPYGFASIKDLAISHSYHFNSNNESNKSLFLSVRRSAQTGSRYSCNIEQMSNTLPHDTNLYIQTNDAVNNGFKYRYSSLQPTINYLDGLDTALLKNPFPAANQIYARHDNTQADIYDSSTIRIVGEAPSTPSKFYDFGQSLVSASGIASTPINHGFDNDISDVSSSNTNYFWGYEYPSKIKLLPIEAGAQAGTRQGSIQRTHEVILRLRSSRGFKIGKDFTNMIDYLSTYFPGSAPSYDIKTGDFRIHFVGNPDNDQLCLLHDIPFPFTIIALILKGVTYD